MYHVVVNHENDTCFGNGLVIGYADCKCLAGLVETSKVVSIVSLALCQTHCKQVPEFSRLSKSDLITWASFGQPQSMLHFHYMLTHVTSLQFLPKGQYGCALAIVFQVRSLYVPTKSRSPSRGHFLESLVI